MSHLPLPLIALFLLTVLLTFFLLAKAVRGSKAALITSVAWVGLQSGVALSGFYLVTNVLPPRFLLVIAPPLVLLIGLLLIPAGRHFLGGMDLKWSVLFHTIRIFVELNLYWLFLYKQVPALLTFEAGNLDILVGLSAPLAWWAYSSGRMKRRGLFIWNVVCLLSVLNALVRAMLSAPFPFQKLALAQPTIAILYSPFVLLPAFIVPSAMLCHLAVFKRLSDPSQN
jgi:hypothetical protein